jgi:uncharacterized membrane protein
MQAAMENSVHSRGLALRLSLLSAVVLGFAALITLVGVMLFDASFQTAAIALVACLISALLAHVAGEYPKGDELITARMAMQMVARTALPVIVAIWGLYFAEPPLEKSLVFYMILFYLIGLITDVQLSLARLRSE